MRIQSKRQLRAELKQKRQEIPAAQRHFFDAAIKAKILAMPEVMHAHCIFCFIAFADEVDTRHLIQELQRQNKIIVVPKTLPDGNMAAILLQSWQDLETDSFGIQVPRSSEPYPGKIDICLTPGLGFSPTGQRLGYGRGYYDTWFSKNQVDHKIAIGYDCQVLEVIPVDETDVPVDKIVTEKKIYVAHNQQ
ncbi:MAG: 5-formyltetrahydrofolate cyclo-ligase [Gammaproteobacteria bacterium]|nr:5-formyltetrahydrofolate cyclo-ligase [Gammaproteobacteria bacterium]